MQTFPHGSQYWIVFSQTKSRDIADVILQKGAKNTKDEIVKQLENFKKRDIKLHTENHEES